MNLAAILHDISYASEVLAYFVTVVYCVKHKDRVSFILLLLMSMIFVTETMGKFKSHFPAYTNVFVVQNVEMLIEMLLFQCVYFFSVRNSVLRSWLGIMIITYTLFACISTILWQPLDKVFPTYSLLVGGLFILIAIQAYFYESIRYMQLYSIYGNRLFYISIGLFIFYANEMPVMTLLNYFLENNTGVDKIGFIFNLKLIVSIIFYSLYSFGIIWTTKK